MYKCMIYIQYTYIYINTVETIRFVLAVAGRAVTATCV